jgi:arginase
MEIDIVSVPFNSSGRSGGVAAAPAALHAQGLMTLLRSALPPGWEPIEPPPVEIGERTFLRNPDTGLLNELALVKMIDGVADTVAASHRAGRLPLLLGGDGPVVLGALVEAGHRPEGPAGLLSLTGRECAWPPTASPTGQAADCTIGLALVAHTNAALSGGLSRRLPLLAPAAVVLLGPRDATELAAADVPSLAGSIAIRSAEDVVASAATNRAAAAYALGRQATEAVEHIRHTTGSWWLHVDLTALSAEEFPATEYRQPGGLTWEQLIILTRAALGSSGLLGWSVTGYDADLDLDRSSAGRVVDYLAQCVSALPAPPASRPGTSDPAGQSPVGPSPTGQAPAGQAPVGQASAGQGSGETAGESTAERAPEARSAPESDPAPQGVS